MNVQRQLNNAYNNTIHDTPFHVLYGYLPSFNDGVLSSAITMDDWKDPTKLQDQIRQ